MTQVCDWTAKTVQYKGVAIHNEKVQRAEIIQQVEIQRPLPGKGLAHFRLITHLQNLTAWFLDDFTSCIHVDQLNYVLPRLVLLPYTMSIGGHQGSCSGLLGGHKRR